ncbi:nicotinate-nucleotide pyrophosphorylase [Candidatus Scalindua japonica]|uniref:Probable nicotinate-nucleotide pyrophosphorylase [carboxylating] n=1 Tax=Candidatus Scalindua japonica TaxID=1284222 RepID=A0A286TZ14_9BACT|nr:carboxylating nicotinate-nucleotide diphosphorylase [Candidatus Scalindua japonica]GAX61143.1 nicotinate-nucleotide pyrophosphorylase [Candidatus Scalindua japonica]
MSKFDFKKIKDLVELAIKEDVGDGDITSKLFVPEGSESDGKLIAKETGIIAGLPVVGYVLSQIDKDLVLTVNMEDGSRVEKGSVIASAKGLTLSLLSAERLVLNFLQRLSGIATATNRFAEKVKGYKTQILDTRKTAPGWRYLEKYAVRIGGGVNHRMGLYDQILIKDNHLKIVDSEKESADIGSLVTKARGQTANGMLIEVEVEDLCQIKEVVNAGVDIILFDNMVPSKIEEAVEMVKELENSRDVVTGSTILTEASGNITIENIEEYAKAGVDRISVGSITHSAKALDISFDIN